MKFSELEESPKLVAINDYIKGWKETHPKETISIAEARVLCMDSNDDVDYNSKGESK